MSVADKVIQFLEQKDVPFKKMEHEPVITSEDAARIRDTDISMGAKALLFIADKDPVLLVVPGNAKVDTKKFKQKINISDLRMATAEELRQITGLDKGAVPPVGKVFNIRSYYDNSFKKMDVVAFNAGSREVSVKMKAQDLIKAEDPVFADISKSNT